MTEPLNSLGSYEGEGNHREQPHNEEVIVHETIETIEFALGCVSNTASYLRLWALSLAHSQLAEVFYSLILAGPIDTGNVILLIIVFPAWAMVTLGVLLCMDSMECFLHSLRLHWYIPYINIYSQG
jgi:V-type H+-transporting ATPase subunit a